MNAGENEDAITRKKFLHMLFGAFQSTSRKPFGKLLDWFGSQKKTVYFKVYILIMGKTCTVKIKWWKCGFGEWGLEVMFLTKIGSYTLKLPLNYLCGSFPSFWSFGKL